MKATIRQNKSAIIAGALAIVLLCGTATGTAMSYFTANVQAQGGHTLKLSSSTEIHEEVVSGIKEVTIQNTGDMPCFVRVKAFADDKHPLNIYGDGWTDGGDGWWYYGKKLLAGEVSSRLDIAITVPEGSKDDFNIVVVHEATVISNADETGGDWSSTISNNGKGA